MEQNTVSKCHSLKIIPISRLTRFARIKSKVVMMILGEADDAHAIPGTIKLTATEDRGVIKKKITFERSEVSTEGANILENYKVSRLIATYVDETGKHRVTGSPNWPLSLDYTTEGGVFIVTLQGEDTATDAFLAN